MPLPDGTNDEKEAVQPALGWQSKEDMRDVVLHDTKASPPCVKIRLFLGYYGVPFTVVKGKKKGSDYKKVPVLMASGRQINDSYVILRNLVPVLCGVPFEDEWQEKITYKLQLAFEAEVFSSSSDMASWASKAVGLPYCIGRCITPCLGPSIAKKIHSKNPGLPSSTEVGREFAAALGSQKFLAGEKPGQVDIAYYGTLLSFKWGGCQHYEDHIREAGLTDWAVRMDACMPNVF